MEWVYDDGGRSKYYDTIANDCTCRAISIATQTDYKEVHDLIEEYAKKERTNKNKKSISSPDGVVYKRTVRKIMTEHFGWKWHTLLKVANGDRAYLRADDLPSGAILCRCVKYDVAVIDGVIHDVFDSSRNGTRCVTGYYSKD